ncbi:ssl0461 [Synechocystis sp. PCC 6803]|uniref:Uncharacterized protein ssl0461 n=1 Tax=Synechocystis sp. (strain ATCC 27184 / PCC 6803 / Kazusa) TaxID=1111708 RepID=Y46S_SYNY3|nr:MULTISPECIES: DUF2555 domain-containing protein [unclassified Synechocystis]P73882.1 RecName: Full=Uncharacterized protein ssl0461 [Synechocystis sp. PCC 6803 substr. Kazusa]MBD2619748.1 DUF2555 domain-containing protein [Synechocystis sp. FACHB-898]MBD2638529.1 DUF2555 domain-containing protein [Synechocystis sp. FACHB-908]MBD2662495.1 DUF2555 domain-containing protein [Synechocystis sp. FACHB-929]AGF51633.1 hypothetical protein MYO_113810 [Synechocystis sp. PCC 6803]QWO81877.1 DUF2555 do
MSCRRLSTSGVLSMSVQNLSKQDVAALTAEDVAQLAQRLENDDYTDAFEGLRDWHLLRAIAFQREDLAEPYLYLLDNETYDEA